MQSHASRMLEYKDICISRELVDYQAFPLSIPNSQDPKGNPKQTLSFVASHYYLSFCEFSISVFHAWHWWNWEDLGSSLTSKL